MKTVIKMASSGLYAGYSPLIPGTVGSIWSILIYLQLYNTPSAYIFVVIMLFLLGFLVCSKAEELYGKKDCRRIVIDEIASLCLVYLFIKPERLMLILGFVLFRIFDVVKPPPARSIQMLRGSAGIMLDDLVAALYTIVALFLVYSLKAKGILL